MSAAEVDNLHYRLFFEAGSEGMLLVSGEGTLLDVNPEACSILGRGRREVLESGLCGVIDTSDPGWRPILDGMCTGEQRKLNLRLVRGDGTLFVAEVSAAKHSDANGESLLGIVLREPRVAGKFPGDRDECTRLGRALVAVTASNARGFFSHRGYRATAHLL